MKEVPVSALEIERFEPVLGSDRYGRFRRLMTRAAEAFRGRRLWNVNSTAEGGGVAEMLTSLLGYTAGAGIEARWLVIEGEDDFFDVTKRIHNRLHGEPGDEGDLGPAERRTYQAGLDAEAPAIAELVGPDDVVILHDPQTAGLAPAMEATGATVAWRSHIGVDEPNDLVRTAWDFLRDPLQHADVYVFSREAYAWEGLDPGKLTVVHPSIDAFSPKNQDLDDDAAAAILRAAGIVDGEDRADPTFRRQDGEEGRVSRRADLIEEAPLPPEGPLVVQVSRWDRLKDPAGVMEGFARHVADRTDAHLVLAGPAVSGVDDDPESETVLEEVRRAREGLGSAKGRIHLACLPLDDLEENGAIVNALQRRAAVVVQKSLAEGFGLTVAEAMWKARPVVASRVGGIQEQIEDGESGVLVNDPTDVEAFGSAVAAILDDPARAEVLGKAAHDRVLEAFLAPRHLAQYAKLLPGFACS